jgi:hypothetical protein
LRDEALDVPGALECGGGGLVRRSPLLAGDRVLDSSGAADQDEATDVEIRARNDMKGDAGPEGVAEEVATNSADRSNDGIAHQGSRRRQVSAHRVRTGVAGQIEADERVVLRQQIAEGSPQARCLREAVQKDNRRSGTRTALFDMEWHAW